MKRRLNFALGERGGGLDGPELGGGLLEALLSLDGGYDGARRGVDERPEPGYLPGLLLALLGRLGLQTLLQKQLLNLTHKRTRA